MLWEELMDWVLGPQGRILILGKFLRSDNEQMRQGGQFMGQKYQYSPYAEEHAKAAVQRILTILKHALDGRNYLVGDYVHARGSHGGKFAECGQSAAGRSLSCCATHTGRCLRRRKLATLPLPLSSHGVTISIANIGAGR